MTTLERIEELENKENKTVDDYSLLNELYIIWFEE